jgi:acyl carrier protein
MTKETDDNSAIAGKIREVIAREGMVDEAKLTREASLEDLEIESIDMVMILQGLEEEFGIYVTMDEEIMGLKNVGDVIDTITRLVESNAQDNA